jgi:hypothetical protein
MEPAPRHSAAHTPGYYATRTAVRIMALPVLTAAAMAAPFAAAAILWAAVSKGLGL